MRLTTITVILLILTGTVLSTTTSGQQRQAIQQLSWLCGTWENKTAKGILYETWVPVSNTFYQGKSYMLHQKDTVVLETIQLTVRKGVLCYIPAVTRQNKGQAVVFTLSSIDDSNVVFENPAHDFPQRISYTRITADSLIAEISGSRGGQKQTRQFMMRRSR